jgi:hypothetical protein
MEAVGNTGKMHDFLKPWFTDWAMFVGMMLLMIPFFIQRLWIVHYKREEVLFKFYNHYFYCVSLPSQNQCPLSYIG